MRLALVLFPFILSSLTAQVLSPGIEDSLLSDPIEPQSESTAVAVLPNGFDTVRLASSLIEVQTALKNSKFFFYRGPADVSFRPFSTDSVIDVLGISFVSRASFQFDENKALVSILLHLDTKALDYYTMYNTLRSKYGEPESVNPSRMLWDDGFTTVILEKPLVVKYLQTDWVTTGSDLERTEYEEQRKTFLDNF